MKADIVVADKSHIAAIAENIREADKLELMLAAMISPVDALSQSLERSDMAWTGLIDSVPVCMFGVVPLTALGNIGSPWLISSRLIDVHAHTFLVRCKRVVVMMAQSYDLLVNWVHEDNIAAIQWLNWLGFDFTLPAVPYGPYGAKFVKFDMVGRS